MTQWNTRWGTTWGTGGGTATLVSIEVTPVDPTWRPTASSDRLQFTAIGHYSDTSTQDLTASVTWSSGSTGVATVASNGQATAVSARNGTFGSAVDGSAPTSLITATMGAISGDSTLAVDVDRDAGSNGKRVPVNAYQWELLGYTGASEAPSHLYLCQETTGATQLSDTIGTAHLTLANTPTLEWDLATAGWDRTGIGLANATGQRASSTAVGDSATDSILVLDYVGYNNATANAGMGVLTWGSNNDCWITCGDTANELTFRYRETSNITESANTYAQPNLHGLILRRNVTGSEVDFFTESEKLTPVWGAAVGTTFALGSASGTVSAPCTHAYVAVWKGSAAEKSDAWIKDLHTVLGWAPTYV